MMPATILYAYIGSLAGDIAGLGEQKQEHTIKRGVIKLWENQ